jgi:hypothetical protein
MEEDHLFSRGTKRIYRIVHVVPSCCHPRAYPLSGLIRHGTRNDSIHLYQIDEVGLKDSVVTGLVICGHGDAGPSLWALISTVIISAMKRAGHGAQLLLSSISNLALWIVCFAFVDDADTVQTAQTVEQTGEDVIQQLQPASNWWCN